MSISRDELVNIFTVVSFLAHAEKDVHVAEKKVLIAVFKAAGITQEEQNKMKSNTSLEEMCYHQKNYETRWSCGRSSIFRR
jgi:hypothetical protein